MLLHVYSFVYFGVDNSSPYVIYIYLIILAVSWTTVATLDLSSCTHISTWQVEDNIPCLLIRKNHYTLLAIRAETISQLINRKYITNSFDNCLSARNTKQPLVPAF